MASSASSASSLSGLGSCSLEVTSSAILLFSFGAKMFSHDPFRVEFHDAYMKKQTSISSLIKSLAWLGKCESEVLRSAFAKKVDSPCVVLTSNQKLQDIERDS